MAKKPVSRLERNHAPQKKHLIDPRYSSPVWTAVTIIILIIIFFINNSQKEPEHGPYPPFYKAGQTTKPDSTN